MHKVCSVNDALLSQHALATRRIMERAKAAKPWENVPEMFIEEHLECWLLDQLEEYPKYPGRDLLQAIIGWLLERAEACNADTQ